MRVWLFQIGEPLPWQKNRRVMRSGRVAKELVQRGHEVIWWTNRFDHYSKTWLPNGSGDVDSEGIQYRLLTGIGYRNNYSPFRFIDHWLVARHFEKLAPGEPRPDLILANLPDHRLAAAAVRFGKKHRIPTILDLRDLWPDLIVDRIPLSFRFLARGALYFDYRTARYAIQSADVLLTMMNGYLSAAYDEKGRVPKQEDRVFPIGAADVSLVEVADSALLTQIKQKAGTRKVVSFIGSLNDTYAPFSMIKVARAIAADRSLVDCFFVIGGDGPQRDKLLGQAHSLDGSVFFTGWLNEAGIAAVLSASSVGYVLSEHPVEAFPNKFFTYASAGIPLICNLLGDMKTLFHEHQIGCYLESSTTEEIHDALASLLNNDDLLTICRVNLKRLFAEKFSVATITATYVKHLENIRSDYQNHD